MDLISVAASAALLAGCGGRHTEPLEAAKDHLAKNEAKAAMIELKTALQRNPSSGEARFLLGKLMLAAGDVEAATVELRRAKDLKFADAQVIPVLARALLVDGEFKRIVDDFGALDLKVPDAVADLKTTLAISYAFLGKKAEAEAALAASFAAVPKYPNAMLTQARLKAGDGDTAGALALIDAVIATGHSKAEALLLKGDLLIRSKSDVAGALEAYGQAVAENATLVTAHASIINIHLVQRNVEAATKQFAALKKALPKHPMTFFLDAQLSYAREDYKRAKEIVQQLLKIAPDNPKLLQFAGAIELQLGGLLQAEAHLNKALRLLPNLPVARRLLTATYVRLGQMDRAIAAINPALEMPDPEPETLAAAAEAFLLNGDAKRAEALYARAAQANPNNPHVRTALALARLAKGNTEGAFNDLAAIAAKDQGDVADLALISARLRRGELDDALRAIDALERKQPTRPLAPFLKGRVQVTKRDLASARTSFERALKADGKYFPAQASLATIDIDEGHPEKALQRFEAVAKEDPRHMQARLAIIELRTKAGADPAEIEKLLVEAVKSATLEVAPRVMLVEHHLAAKDYKQALTVAQESAAVLPNKIEMLDALGRAQAATGDTQQAISTFNKINTLQPKLIQPLLRLADIYIGRGDLPAATLSLKRALEIDPTSSDIQRRLVDMAVRAKKPEQALIMARDIQKQQPNSAQGLILEAEVEVSRKNWPAAITLLRAALNKPQNAVKVPVRLHYVLLLAGQKDEAARFATSWVKEHPKDTFFLVHLGDVELGRKDYAAAERRYLDVLKVDENEPNALNNIAWLMVQRNAKGAAAYAHKAVGLYPGQIAFLDTLALSLAVEGQIDQALITERRVVDSSPDVYVYRLNLAKLYLQAGKKDAARAELERLAKAG
ncbi:MAG: PEP-CTERM system TPR-repeat protein PrsT, partial [Burkholderiales bacterium]|nr:PEP-CTERM system TPR-repeat protein PrsT [Burkholderiales bacterium]